MQIHSSVIGVVALIGALAILAIFALADAYAVRSCFKLANAQSVLPDLCAPEHLFRTTLEIGGMAIGLYGVSKVMRS